MMSSRVSLNPTQRKPESETRVRYRPCQTYAQNPGNPTKDPKSSADVRFSVTSFEPLMTTTKMIMMQRLSSKLRSLALNSAKTLPYISSSRRLLHSSPKLRQPLHSAYSSWSFRPFLSASSSPMGVNSMLSSQFPLSVSLVGFLFISFVCCLFTEKMRL